MPMAVGEVGAAIRRIRYLSRTETVGASAAACPQVLQQLGKLLRRQSGLAKDVSQSAGRYVLVPMNGNRHTVATVWAPQLAVASFACDVHEARAMERGQHVTGRDDRQVLHTDASTVTMGVSLSGGGTGSPSATSPLMWQRMASSARSRASVGVAPNVRQPGSAGTDTFHALPSDSGSRTTRYVRNGIATAILPTSWLEYTCGA